MPHLHVKRGLDLAISGMPQGPIRSWFSPARIALDFKAFRGTRIKLLVKIGQDVLLGEPLAEDRDFPGRFFPSPTTGRVLSIAREEKRALRHICITRADREKPFPHQPPNWKTSSRQTLVDFLLKSGLFCHIRQRPFGMLANPEAMPKSIFVKAIETAPFTPKASLQMQGHEEAISLGLTILTRLTDGFVHVIQNSNDAPLKEIDRVQLHTIAGPHPAGNASTHIHFIDPILHENHIIWTLNILDVMTIGYQFLQNRYFTDRIISIAGPGFSKTKRGFYRAQCGLSIEDLCQGNPPFHLISGNPLTGWQVKPQDFLGFDHTVLSGFPENKKRRIFSFLWPWRQTTDISNSTRIWGEKRAFVDGAPYDQVMPLDISTELLLKAVITKNDDLADELGLLEVASEDFALPAFVCPSKIEMIEIMQNALIRRAFNHT